MPADLSLVATMHVVPDHHRTLARENVRPQEPSSPLKRFTAAIERLTIFNKVLIANVTIVVIGAVAGTWITVAIVRDENDERFYPLALFFAVAGIFLSLVVNLIALRAAFRPLAELQEAAIQVRRGDVALRIDGTRYGDPEIRELIAALNGTLDALARDRTEITYLATQVVRAQEDERRRIARELHDDTAQVLFALLLRLSAFKTDADPIIMQFAEGLEVMTSEALESVRRLAFDLRPPALDDLGLQDALGALVQRFSDQVATPIEFTARGLKDRLPGETELVLYRIAQEALTNVSKHSRATEASVTIDRAASGVTLVVRDDGVGFDPARASHGEAPGLGLGIFGMQERALLVRGTLSVKSRPGFGTAVTVFVPLETIRDSDLPTGILELAEA